MAVALFAFLALLFMPSGVGADDKSALELFGPMRKDMALGSPGYSSPRFSPDGKLLAFDVCDKSKCENAIYDIANDRYFAFRDKQGRRITNVSFSPSGQKLTFVVKEQKGFLWWAKPQDRIAVGSMQDMKFALIASPEGMMMHPEFLGEKAVLFLAEVVISGKEGDYKNRQLYVTDIGGDSSRMVAPQKYGFYGPSRVRPLWDGKHLVLGDYGFSKRRIPITERFDKKFENIKYQNEVLLISISKETVTPISVVVTEPYQPAPASAAKQLYVVGRLDHESATVGHYVHDVFAVDKDKTERVSRLAVYIYGMDVNPDGTFLALIVPTSDRVFTNGRLLLYDTRNHSYRELKPKVISELLAYID